jgi:SAM-dependent methyltransferase
MKHSSDAAEYGDRIAEIYDDLYPEIDQDAIGLLKRLAQGGSALELGIGTGRVAIPLHEQGVDITGIDASEAMIARLKGKPQSGGIDIVAADFAQFQLGRTFDLIYVVFNTFFALTTQEQQLACLRSISTHLNPGGSFLIEAFIPDLGRYTARQSVRLVDQTVQGVQLTVAQLDPVAQTIFSHHILVSEAGIRLYPVKLRYAWPAELDLMAAAAGLGLKHRWADWSELPIEPHCTRHISVYGN